MKVLVITVYIGPLPGLMPLWLRSAGANPQIDFLVVTDQPTPADVPANVRFQQADLASLRDHWSQQTGIEVALETPYKLNDFKPLFWSLAENIEAYDYWGYCDLDVVFGNLDLVMDGRLGRYDMILSEGHLRLLRNDAATREAWRTVSTPRSWTDIMTDPANFGMDEHHGINRIFREPGRSWFANSGLVADIDPGFRQLRLLPQFPNFRCQGFFWDNGAIYREAWTGGRRRLQEFAYIHLQKRKLAIDPAAVAAPAFDFDSDAIRPLPATAGSKAAIAGRNPWHWPNFGEARIIARQWRRQLTGWQSPFAPVDRPESGTLA